ncbi:MAG: UDP-N-acetylmuramoyl-tripeptide--D-alanyl-D-alanine ligase [Fuerstiella sp.]
MHPLSIRQICELTGGSTAGHVNLSAIIDGCVIDSRDVQRGDAFFALEGTHCHGAEFATAALRDGASVVIVDETAASRCHCDHVAVPDAEIALAQIANRNRQLSDALIVAVTGSVGKTTTREMIAAVLGSVHPGIQSPRNFNNQLGVPLSLLELQEGDEFGVIEIGASSRGETTALASVAEPEFAVVTRIAPAHLKGFQSVQAVQHEKSQLVRALPDDGVAFLNADDPLVAAMASVAPCRVITFGTSETATVRVSEIDPGRQRLRLVVDGCEYTVPACGRHNATSAAAAIAVGREVGLDPADIDAGLQKFRSQPGRCCVAEIGPWAVIDDTYNSSPASVTAAIRTVEEFRDCRHRILVLGDMLDLGEQAADLHYSIGASLAASQVHHIALIGEFADDVVEGFLASAGGVNRISRFSDMTTLTTMLGCLLSDNDVVLVKGSRSTAMERVVEHLRGLATDQPNGLRRAA